MAHDDIALLLKKIEGLSVELSNHRTCAERHWAVNVAFMDEMRPVLEAQKWIIYTQKFLKWTGLSIIATFGFLYLLYKKL